MTRKFCLALVCMAALGLVAAGCTNPEKAKQQAFTKGKQFAAEGKLGEAVVEYQNAIKRDARFGEARWELAQTYERQQDFAAAMREFVRAADLLPTRVDVQVRAAGYLLLAERFEDARSRADVALKTDPKNIDALLIRANATAGLKDITTAVSQIEEALKIAPTEGRIYTSLGAMRVAQGDRAEAEAAFKKAIEVSPKAVEPRLALANYYWTTGQVQPLEQTLNDARAIDPNHLLLNRMLAGFYMATNRIAEAEAPLKVVADRSGLASARLALADYYVRAQRPGEATPILKELAKTKDNFAGATMRLAYIERTEGHRDAANQQLDSVLKASPRSVEALTMKALWQLADDNPAGAVASARSAVAADASSVPAQFALGQALAANKDVDGAIKALNEVLRLNPRIAPAQLLLSRLQLAAGNPEAAVQLATEARKAAPASAEAQLTLARSLIATDKADQAEPIVKSLVAQYPQSAAVQIIDGHFKMLKRDPAGARAAYERALTADADAIEALDGLLRLDIVNHTVPAAVTRIEARTAAHPDNAQLLMVAGRTYSAAGDLPKAETTLRRVIELNPDDMNAYFLLGRNYYAQRRLDEALAQFDAAAKRRPGDVGMSTMAAMILQLQNKTDEARKRYEAIVTGNPKAAVAANNLAWMYVERGEKLDVALQFAQSAKSQLPNSPEVNDTLGWIYYKKNLPLLAIPPLEQSIAANKANPLFRLHLGLAYAKAGNAAKAREALETALRLNPQVEGADLAKQTLASLKG